MPTSRIRTALLTAAVGAGLTAQLVAAGAAGAVTVTKLELKNGQLRLEAKVAQGGGFVSVESATTGTGGYSANGLLKVQATNFTAPDCRLVITDINTTTGTPVTIPNCTPNVTPVPATPAAPSGSCVINPVAASTAALNADAAVGFTTSGCVVPNAPAQWTIVAGVQPTGWGRPIYQGYTAGNVSGRAVVTGTYRFTIQVADNNGQTDQENVTVTVR